MEMKGITQVRPNWWMGRRVIVLDAVPRMIPPTLSGELLSLCRQEGMSIELSVLTGEKPRQLSLLLILRAESAYSCGLLDLLERVSGMMQRHLKQAGFQARTAEEQDEACAGLFRLMGGGLSRTHPGAGFFPTENRVGPQGYYVPGRYQADGGKQLDLTRVASVLAAYPNALFSIQISPTALTAQEWRAIARNKAWYAQRPNDDSARAALGAMIQWERMRALPLFFVSMFCVGSQDCVRDLCAQMRYWNYAAYPIPQPVIQKPGYLRQGLREMAYLTAEAGHRADMIGKLYDLRRLTHIAPLNDVVSALPLPPSCDGIPGVEISAHRAAVRLPASMTDETGLFLGKQDGESVFLPPDQLTRHGFIVGKPGSGKTTFALGLLYQLSKRNYPFLAIEPVKCEYRSLLSVIPDLRIYTPGKTGVSPVGLNPFLPPQGVTLEEYLPNLDTIFGIAIAMDHPLDVIVPQVIRACYRQYGWRPDSTRESPDATIFGMSEFICAYRDYIRQAYAEDAEARNNLESGGVVRLQALIRSHPVLFDTNQSMDFEELLRHPTVFELDAIDNNDLKALILAILMVQVMLVIRKRGQYGGALKNVIMIDEAHLLLGQAGAVQEGAPNPRAAGISLLQNMTLILRAYGTALLFGDQSPAKLTREIMDNVNLKMMFRLDSQRDRGILADTALMDGSMLAELVNLPAGKGFLYVDALTAPICVVTPNSKADLMLSDGVEDDQVAQRMRPVLQPPFAQCARCASCARGCDGKTRIDARFLAETLAGGKDVTALLSQQDQEPLADFLADSLPAFVQEDLDRRKEGGTDAGRLLDCAKVQFIRLLRETGRCTLTDDALAAAAWPQEKQREQEERIAALLQKMQIE